MFQNGTVTGEGEGGRSPRQMDFPYNDSKMTLQNDIWILLQKKELHINSTKQLLSGKVL